MSRFWPALPAVEVMAIRVLYLHHVAQHSGAENSILLLLRHLDCEKVAPMFAGPITGPFPEALAKAGVPILPVSFGPLRDLRGVVRSVKQLRALIREHQIDLLQANGPQTNICAGLAGRLSQVPVVWHVRNLVYGGMHDVDRMFARLASRIICNSDAVRERFRTSPMWTKSTTILNAVDTKEFNLQVPRKPFRQELGIAPDEIAVGIVGRIGLGKGHDTFIEAAIQLLQIGCSQPFLIVGDPLFPEDAWRVHSLRRRIKEANLEDRIRFTGYRSDMPSVMRGLDILVLASHAEPCGRVLFEAMASGTAIVATNSGGTPEIVRDGYEGLLVPPQDPYTMARAIGRLIEAPLLRADLGRAALARAQSEFTVERYVTRTLEVYAAALRRI